MLVEKRRRRGARRDSAGGRASYNCRDTRTRGGTSVSDAIALLPSWQPPPPVGYIRSGLMNRAEPRDEDGASERSEAASEGPCRGVRRSPSDNVKEDCERRKAGVF